MFGSYGDKFEVVSVDNLAVDNISEHLKGVDAVIHAAAPLPSASDAKGLLQVSLTSNEFNIMDWAYALLIRVPLTDR